MLLSDGTYANEDIKLNILRNVNAIPDWSKIIGKFALTIFYPKSTSGVFSQSVLPSSLRLMIFTFFRKSKMVFWG